MFVHTSTGCALLPWTGNGNWQGFMILCTTLLHTYYYADSNPIPSLETGSRSCLYFWLYLWHLLYNNTCKYVVAKHKPALPNQTIST